MSLVSKVVQWHMHAAAHFFEASAEGCCGQEWELPVGGASAIRQSGRLLRVWGGGWAAELVGAAAR